MTNAPRDERPDLSRPLGGLSPGEWRDAVDAIGEQHGYYLPLGPDHAALFVDAGPRLLVTFEEVDTVRRRPGARPVGFDMVETEGWSLLTILAEGRTFYRDPALTWFFDRQVDDGFFEDFDQVLFFGEGMGGYGAAAYSVTAPAANVLLMRPVASLDPAIAAWDRRDMAARGRDFSSRYGYAPEMLDAASAAWVIHDPLNAPDAMHATLFRRPNVTVLRAPLTGAKLGALADLMEITQPLLLAAMEGTLDRTEWGRLWRRRRGSVVYPRQLLRRAEALGRPDLVARIVRFGMTTRDAALYEERARALGLNVVRLRERM